MRAIDLFARIYDLPPAVRNRLLSAGIPRVIPIAAGLRIKVLDVDDERAVTTMPYTRRASNHIGTLYIGALLVQAETTMATLVVGQCRPPAFRVLVKKNEAEFLARASGTVRCVCNPLDDERAGLDRLRALRNGKGEEWITVHTESVDEGKPVCTVRFLVSVKHG